MTSPTGSARRILGDLKKSVSWDETCLGGRRLLFACSRRPLWRVPHVLGDRWKSQKRKIVPLSPYVEEPLNSKVMKSFVPEQRSCQVFFVFRDSYVLCYIYIYIWTLYVHFAHIRIWVWYRQIWGFGWATFRWAMMTSIVTQNSSLVSGPTTPSLNPHYNRPSGHWA